MPFSGRLSRRQQPAGRHARPDGRDEGLGALPAPTGRQLRATGTLSLRCAAFHYIRRLRSQRVEELLAVSGIAISVMLVLSTLLASQSIEGSAQRVLATLIGPAKLQLRARGPEGFQESLLSRAESLPGVAAGAPLLEATADATARDGAAKPLTLVGADVSLATLDGLAHTIPLSAISGHGIDLTSAAAKALGISSLPSGRLGAVRLSARGRAFVLPILGVLGPRAIGALAGATAAMMPLENMQRILGLQHRLSRVLIVPQAGMQSAVSYRLGLLASPEASVVAANQDIQLLRQALRPGEQAATVFAGIAAGLGLLFAFNAVLLGIPARRIALADMRMLGGRRSALALLVAAESLLLGLVGSLAGIALGYLLARTVMRLEPGYLAIGFTLGSSTIVSLQPFVLALAAGLLSSMVASLGLLADLRASTPLHTLDLDGGSAGMAGGRALRRLAAAGICALVLALALIGLLPQLSIPMLAIVAFGLITLIPGTLALATGLAAALSNRLRGGSALALAGMWLRSAGLRTLALLATGTIALFGSLTLSSARSDALGGYRAFALANSAGVQLFVTPPGDGGQAQQFLAPGLAGRLRSLPSVASVQEYGNGFLDLGDRRVLLSSRDERSGLRLLEAEILSGEPRTAIWRIISGNWIAVSAQLAEEHHLDLGDVMNLPTPSGIVEMRIAATTTSFGWTGGSILIGNRQYRRLFHSGALSALAVTLRPGASQAAGLAQVRGLLGRGSGLEATGAEDWVSHFQALAFEALGQVQEISQMLLVAALLALGAALASAIWQRRPALAAARLDGARRGRLAAALLSEVLIALSICILLGFAGGMIGEYQADSFLSHTSNLPIAHFSSPSGSLTLSLILLASVVAVAAAPIMLAIGTPSRLALSGE